MRAASCASAIISSLSVSRSLSAQSPATFTSVRHGRRPHTVDERAEPLTEARVDQRTPARDRTPLGL
jgi:hypothetical protein